MRPRHQKPGSLFIAIVLASAMLFATGWGGKNPSRDESGATKKLENLPRPEGERAVVTIYEFRSGVPEVSAASATDMFTTALIKSGAFAVAERHRLNEGVMIEKQLSAQGLTTGNVAEKPLAGAGYIFEGIISEANPSESNTGVGGTYRGLGVESSSERAVIGLDVRVLDAATGLVLDSVNVRKDVAQSGYSVKGVGAFARSFLKKDMKGADISLARDRREGVDQALRACIEEAVYQLVTRYGK